MSGTIRAKLDGWFWAGNDDDNGRACFKFIWDHLKELEAAGVVTEIARNNGTGATTGSTGWWNESNAFGLDAWAVFRWNSNSNRSWEWYFYMQAASNYGAGVGAPALVQAGTSIDGLSMAVAVSVNTSSGVTSNPWGGSTGSLGADTKGNPVWTTGSVGDTVFVFPRSNSLSGTHVTSKQNLWSAQSEFDNMRMHVITDDDSFLGIFGDPDTISDYSRYWMSFIGPYTPSPILFSSVKTPLMVIQTKDDANGLFDPNDEYGGTAGSSNNCGGGIIAADGESVRNLRVDYLRPTMGFGLSSDQWGSEIHGHISGSSTGDMKHNQQDIFLFVNTTEAAYQGYVGLLNNQLIKVVRYSHLTRKTPDGSKITFNTNRNWISSGDESVVLVPWTGSVDVGKNLGIRDGVFSGSIG